MNRAWYAVRGVWALVVCIGALAKPGAGQSVPSDPTHLAPRTTNVILVVIDGVRWQDVFRGGDCALMTKDQGVDDTLATRARFCRGSTDSARAALMPFLWGTVAREGLILGDRDHGGDAHISNTMKFSYPGYNEILTGRFDPRIDKNGYGPNPNVTVFEWLAHRTGFAGKVRVWGTWDAFDAIFNEARAGIPVRSGWDVPFPTARGETETELDALWATATRWWSYMPPDAFLQRAVLQSWRKDRPRLMFVGFGEPDEWAHDRRYDHYLESLHAADGYLRDLWTDIARHTSRATPRTTLLIITDHGRGRTPRDWTDHGRDVDGAEEIWMAGIGAGIPRMGPVTSGPPFVQAQMAATIVRMLGYDWREFNADAAPPVDFGSYTPTASTMEHP